MGALWRYYLESQGRWAFHGVGLHGVLFLSNFACCPGPGVVLHDLNFVATADPEIWLSTVSWHFVSLQHDPSPWCSQMIPMTPWYILTCPKWSQMIQPEDNGTQRSIRIRGQLLVYFEFARICNMKTNQLFCFLFSTFLDTPKYHMGALKLKIPLCASSVSILVVMVLHATGWFGIPPRKPSYGSCISFIPTMWGPPVISWFRFAPVTSSLFAYHEP